MFRSRRGVIESAESTDVAEMVVASQPSVSPVRLPLVQDRGVGREICLTNSCLETLPRPVSGDSSTYTSFSGHLCFIRPRSSRNAHSWTRDASGWRGDLRATAHTVAPVGVGQADDCDLIDQGVGAEDIFDLLRGNVLALASDQVLGPAGENDVSIGRYEAAVTVRTNRLT